MNNQLSQKRFRNYGFKPGLLPTGKRNSIADVGEVKVGHVTVANGRDTCTGLTLIDPGVSNLFHVKLPAAVAIGNGYGKMTGISQIEELGTLETPIVLTNTHAVGKVMRGVVGLVIRSTPQLEKTQSVNAVVGETNDGYLNDIQKDVLESEHVRQAAATISKDFEIGCVGAGKGTRAFSWKGGIGTSSRTVRMGRKSYTVGALVQTNFGGALTIMGVPVGKLLGKTDFEFVPSDVDGSCMIVLATDAPLDSRQLKRLARRGLLGMVKTGSIMATGSGDYAIAFSTKSEGQVEDSELNPLFLAAVESVEESIYDALFTATDTTGRSGHKLVRLPVEKVVSFLKKYAAI